MILNLGGALLFGIISLGILWLSWKKGFFLSHEDQSPIPLRWFDPLAVFSIYFLVALLAPLPLATLLQRFVAPIPPIAISCWLTFIMSLLILLSISLYALFLPKEISKKIWQNSQEKSPLQDVYTALLCCAISFPFILFLGELFDLLIYFIFHIKDLPEQLAVLFLKMTLNYPFYFFLTVITVVFFAPCIEETLFRGFFQSFLKRHLSAKTSIVITSFCFAFFHYSSEQGLSNISIVGSLFVLSLFLGFIYEKRKSLLAPIFLHASFNTISVINLYFSGLIQ